MARHAALAISVACLALAGCADPCRTARMSSSHGTFLGWNNDQPDRPLMNVRGEAGDEEYAIHVPATAEVVVDGGRSALDRLRPGMAVELVCKDKTVIKVDARSP